MSNNDCEAIYIEATLAGQAAADALTCRPMTVIGDGKSYYISDGVCGFAWINVKGTSTFGRFLKKEKGCSKGYPTGVSWWIHDYNQSMQKKEAFAHAAASVLVKHGIDSRPGSRMD